MTDEIPALHRLSHRTKAAMSRVCLLALPTLFLSLLTLGGCDPRPARPPTIPEPPRPKLSSDGYPKSLLGNAILSNALLSFKVQCNEQRASIRICRIPPQVHTNRQSLDT